MIWESYEWKTYLKRLLRDLQRKVKDADEEVPFLVERNIFIIAFVIRKMIDSHKVTDKVANLSFSFPIFPKISDRHHDRTHHTEDPKYWDLCSKSIGKLKIRDLCNEIIHSDILTWVGGRHSIEGFFIASDFRAPKRLVKVDFETYFEITSLILDDDITSIQISYDETGKIRKRLLG